MHLLDKYINAVARRILDSQIAVGEGYLAQAKTDDTMTNLPTFSLINCQKCGEYYGYCKCPRLKFGDNREELEAQAKAKKKADKFRPELIH